MPNPPLKSNRVLFVCTGNIFRSLTAEYALRRVLAQQHGDFVARADIVVASAGTEDFPHLVRPVVRDYLLQQGLDVRAHRRRTLTAQIVADATHVIAMSTDHRATLRDHFGCAAAPLFTTACGLPDEPLPDVDEAIVDYATNPDAVAAHVRLTIDRIIELTPLFAARLLQR